MATPDAADGSGASWPDVALAIVAFAREDTEKFLVVLVILAMLRESYRAARSKRRGEASAAEDRSNG